MKNLIVALSLTVVENVFQVTEPIETPTAITEALNQATRVSNRFETVLENGSKIIFRRDFGEYVHLINSKYPQPVDHYKNRVLKVENIHIIVDKDGKVVDVFGKNKKSYIKPKILVMVYDK